MSFRVELTARAYADLNRLMAWFEDQSQADRLSRQSYRAVDRLEFQPYSCGFPYENRFFRAEIRYLLFRVPKGKPYRALFIVQDDVVKILCIRAPGKKPVKPRDVRL